MTENKPLVPNDDDCENESADSERTVAVSSEERGGRLDSFVSDAAGITRSYAQKLIEDGSVTVNSRPSKKNYKLSEGDIVSVVIPAPEEYGAFPEDIPLDVVYEDDDIIIVNKPVGMVVHPAPGHSSGTLVNALMHHCGSSLSGIGGVARPGIVHRIDRDTTGLICAAKNDSAHLSLASQLADHTMHREYKMIVTGNLREDSGTIDKFIGRHPTDRKKMAVLSENAAGARNAVTHWRVLERFCSFTYAEAVLETGRTHQIRVHLASIGHPLMGDTVYGGGGTQFERRNQPLINGQMLHATALVLLHPRTGEKMRFETPLPENFTEILEKLRKTMQ